GVVHHFYLVCAKEDEIARLRTAAGNHGAQRFRVYVLVDSRMQAFRDGRRVVDLDIGQTPGSIDADELGVGVDLAVRHARTARHTQRGPAACWVIGRRLEDLEIHALHQVGHTDELDRVAQIVFVRATTLHGFFPPHR